jgi:cellulose synthase/poly-beta-1,6-N-acetylglucosamine synthase-like glycosyltransferase
MTLLVSLFTWALAVVALGALLPSLVLLVEVLLSLARRPPAPTSAPVPRMAVVVPAHDEAGQIAATVRGLRAELGPGDRLLVVADNCQDDTAALAANAGAEVIERNHAAERGKGFAISFAVAHLAKDPPDVVVLVDADCVVATGRLSTLAQAARHGGTAVQADYVLAAPAGARGLHSVNAFAILVRNRVRPLGLDRVAHACQLTGSGMAFPWPVLAQAPAMRGNLVEDMALGLELALQGRAPRLCPAVRVSSDLPAGGQAGLRQRRRWEHGQLHTMASYVPRLLVGFLRRPDRALLGLALDLLVPPLALLVMIQAALLLVTGAAAGWQLSTAVPFALAVASFTSVLAAIAVAWLGFGRQTLALTTALQIPFYVLWKVGLYAKLLVSGKHKAWERTERGPTEPPRPPAAA